jgi:hypothetical protein
MGLNPAEVDGFSRAINIRSTTSFGGEVKPSAPCRKILGPEKNPRNIREILVGKIHGHFCVFSPALLLGVSDRYYQRALAHEAGII